jgi:hypothetical protein
MNRNHPLLMLAMFMALLSCFSSANAQPIAEPDNATGVEGVISVSPIHGGPARPGIPNSRPLANTAFVVENEKGTVASFQTDEQGRFRISLAAGHYTISLKDRKGGIGRYGPFPVDVVAGKTTTVEWRCDTGMR